MIYPSQYCVATGQGRRDNQEDRFLCMADHGTFAVADGIGGHPDGDIAAQLTVDTVRDVVLHNAATPADPPLSPGDIMRQAAIEANKAVFDCADPILNGHRTPGSTMTAIRFPGFRGDSEENPDEVACINVGDSRLYRLRAAGSEKPITVQQLTADQAGPWGLMMRMGKAAHDFVPESRPVPCQPGDLLLLATDGLWCHVDPSDALGREVEFCMRTRGFSEIAQWLVDICERSGGRDNTTVIVVEVGKRGEIVTDLDAV